MNIDLSERFPHLSRAPIVEAAIDLRAILSVQLHQEDFQKCLKQKLPDYPTAQPQLRFQGEIKAEAGKPLEQHVVDLGWIGLMFRSQDQHNVAQFQKEGFTFSRLEPYQDWQAFEAEAFRLWKTYVELARPVAIQRIGVRFINRMLFPADGFRLDEYVSCAPQPLPSLGLIRGEFFHHDTLQVPGTNYVVNLIRTVQPAEGMPLRIPVILDIDVFSNAPMELDEARLKKRLSEMRWLKNKTFFDSITAKTEGTFR